MARGTGREMIIADRKNATYPITPLIERRTVLNMASLFFSVIGGLLFDGIGAIKGSPPPVTIGEKVVDCGRVGF